MVDERITVDAKRVTVDAERVMLNGDGRKLDGDGKKKHRKICLSSLGVFIRKTYKPLTTLIELGVDLIFI